jgi:hypothetical protein
MTDDPTATREGERRQTTTAIVVYCPRCDYFKKTAVHGPVGTHGCHKCGGLMEVYVPQERVDA